MLLVSSEFRAASRHQTAVPAGRALVARVRENHDPGQVLSYASRMRDGLYANRGVPWAAVWLIVGSELFLILMDVAWGLGWHAALVAANTLALSGAMGTMLAMLLRQSWWHRLPLDRRLLRDALKIGAIGVSSAMMVGIVGPAGGALELVLQALLWRRWLKLSVRSSIVCATVASAFHVLCVLSFWPGAGIPAVSNWPVSVPLLVLAGGGLALLVQGWNTKPLSWRPVIAYHRDLSTVHGAGPVPRGCPEPGWDRAASTAQTFRPSRRRAVLIIAGVVMVALGLLPIGAQLAAVSPRRSTAAILGRLPNTISAPWIWDELDSRLQTGKLSRQEVDQAITLLAAGLSQQRTAGRPPLQLPPWAAFIRRAAAARQVSPAPLIALCKALGAVWSSSARPPLTVFVVRLPAANQPPLKWDRNNTSAGSAARDMRSEPYGRESPEPRSVLTPMRDDGTLPARPIAIRAGEVVFRPQSTSTASIRRTLQTGNVPSWPSDRNSIKSPTGRP